MNYRKKQTAEGNNTEPMTKKQKITSGIVMSLFLIVAVLCSVLMNEVSVNYSISDYLDDSTDTKIALQIIEDEFGMTTDMKVMVKDVDVDTANAISAKLEDVDKVLSVTFDAESEKYYKDDSALFLLVLDGDDYSEETSETVNNVKALIAETSDKEAVYGGTSVLKQSMRENITEEMVWILAIAVVLIVVILLLMSASWLEPLTLLIAAAVAIVINLGTNVIFGEISYITNSVAAILQLALSIDYSIILLNEYRKNREEIKDAASAMKRSVISVIKPVSASAMTTLAGLMALLFMSFKIGFDIGIVLMKGILISAVVSMTFFPLLVLLMEKPMEKTAKRPLRIKGQKFCSVARKAGKAVLPVFLAVVIVCGVLSNCVTSYIFSEPGTAGAEITDTFGKNNTMVLVYKNGEDNIASESEFIEKVSEMKKYDGTSILTTHTAYSNTVKELYGVDKIVKRLNVSTADATYLLTMYHLYEAPDSVKMAAKPFAEYAEYLIENDADAAGFADGETDSLKKLLSSYEVMNTENTASEFYTRLTNGLSDGTNLSLFSVKQIYGLYFYDEISQKAVDFQTMLDHTIDVTDTGAEFDGAISGSTHLQLKALSKGINQFNIKMEQPLTKAEFQGFMYQNYGVTVDDVTAGQIYGGYYALNGQPEQETIPFLPLMKFLVSQNQITEPTAVATVNGYDALYTAIHSPYEYTQFLPALSYIAESLSGITPTVNASAEEIQQIYVSYFIKTNTLPDKALSGRTLVRFISDEIKKGGVIASRLDSENEKQLADLQRVDAFMSDFTEYSYQDITAKLNLLQTSLETTNSEVMTADKVSGVYIKYAAAKGVGDLSEVAADELVRFVSDNADCNELLAKKLTDENRRSLNEAKQDIETATELFTGENYSRLLMTFDLEAESDDTEKFMNEVVPLIDEIFGEEAYLAGETPSTYDLKDTFSRDNIMISVFTVAAIFLIVALIFRSLSLPIVLVTIIQGAIWIMMSLLLIPHTDVFFMSYIISTCILMGATIDYGVLMSSNYVKLRRSTEKKQALQGAVEAAIPTVFSSGLILTVAGLVISIISTENAISTVGLLVGIGAFVSSCCILFVLPSVLYALDKFVMKLTFSKSDK